MLLASIPNDPNNILMEVCSWITETVAWTVIEYSVIKQTEKSRDSDP